MHRFTNHYYHNKKSKRMKEKNKKVGSYLIRMEQCLGRGGFATTYKAFKDKNFNEPYACKVIKKQDI